MILAVLLAPIAAFTANSEGRLIRPLRWMETHDVLGWSGPLSERKVAEWYHKYGKRVAMTRWLMRNKAYSLRYNIFGKEIDEQTSISMTGTFIAKRRGFSYRLLKAIKEGKTVAFEYEIRVGFGIGIGMFYFRMGWKLAPFFDDMKRKGIAVFQPLTPRTDDWDDYDLG